MIVDITPDELASRLGVPPYELRAFFRERYPTRAPGKGGRWRITMTMLIAATRYFH